MIYPINMVNNVQYNTSFQGIRRVPVKEIKNLPRLTCPRCGGPIIEPQKLIEAFRTICLPLSRILKKGHLDETQKFPAVWKLLNDFAQQYPTSSLDKILESDENHTLFRETIERTLEPNADLSNRDFYNMRKNGFDKIENVIRTSARQDLRSSSVVMKRLKSFLPYLKEIERTEPFKTEIQGKIGAFEELMYYSTVYPHKSLSEIINLPEVKSHNEAMRDGLQQEFQHKQRIAFNNMRALIKRKLKCDNSVLNIFQNKLMAILFKSNKDPGIRLYDALNACKNFTEENNCQSIYYKLYDIIKSIPEPPYNKYVELCNCIGKDCDIAIINSILRPYIGTEEHVVARSLGGVDEKYNKISMHKGCNSKRSNIPYKEYLNIYPTMPYYTCKQVDQVSDYIYRDMMVPKFYFYPVQVSKTLKDATDGSISPDCTKYCKKALKKSQAKLDSQRETIQKLAEKRDNEIIELNKLKAKENQIRENIETVNKERQQALDEQKEERRIFGYLSKVLESKE